MNSRPVTFPHLLFFQSLEHLMRKDFKESIESHLKVMLQVSCRLHGVDEDTHVIFFDKDEPQDQNAIESYVSKLRSVGMVIDRFYPRHIGDIVTDAEITIKGNLQSLFEVLELALGQKSLSKSPISKSPISPQEEKEQDVFPSQETRGIILFTPWR